MEYPTHSNDMTYSDFGHPVFDCDFHLYEKADAFTRHLPEQHKGVIKLVQVDGRTKIAVRNRLSDYIPNPTFEVVAAPGSGMEYFAAKNPTGKSFREIVTPMRTIPEFTDKDARIALMDRMHVQATINYPTLASLIEVNFMDDPELTQVLVHAYNEWLYDEWGFNYQGRIYTTPVMNLSTCEGAVKELEWALERGARVMLVRPAPVAGWRSPRSPFLPEFDPFWARVQESGILYTTHTSDCGYQRYANDWLGRGGEEFLAFEQDAFSLASVMYRPIMDALIAACAHGMFARFPNIKVATTELGSTWLPRVVDDLALTYKKVPQQFAEHPLDTLKRVLYVSPFWEDPLEPVIDILGIDHVLFSSDWPHPEGLADPVGYYKFCKDQGISDDDIAKIMGGNMFSLVSA
ncbi:MAG TPA: amidohydrolase family protein [Acidimicrobiales bacterium]|nr:amidohydrolase family protein [Acidimicrobiales bacterium]